MGYAAFHPLLRLFIDRSTDYLTYATGIGIRPRAVVTMYVTIDRGIFRNNNIHDLKFGIHFRTTYKMVGYNFRTASDRTGPSGPLV